MAVDRAFLPQDTRIALVEREADDLRGYARDHETRIRVVERLGFRLTAYATVGGSAAGVITALVSVVLAKAGL
jgi:hypothetical protein